MKIKRKDCILYRVLCKQIQNRKMNQTMENGRTEQIIEQLTDQIENGKSAPFSPGKVLVDKAEMTRMLRELANIVRGELKIYREVNDRKGKILTEAKQEAEAIVMQAERSASRIRVTKHMSTIPAFHPGDLEPEDREALRTAGDIYAASLIYTDEMLTEVNDLLADSYDVVCRQYEKLVNVLEEKTKIVEKNKAELMGNLKELSKEERYAQILEVGQLLSNELYDERNKARMAAKLREERMKNKVMLSKEIVDESVAGDADKTALEKKDTEKTEKNNREKNREKKL